MDSNILSWLLTKQLASAGLVFCHKSDAQAWLLSKLKSESTNKGVSIQAVRSDQGSEIKCNSVQEFFANAGISFEETPSYTPALNGIAERIQRTIITKARCMLAESGLPILFIHFISRQTFTYWTFFSLTGMSWLHYSSSVHH